MFNNQKENSTNLTKAETIIGPSIKVNGNFHGEGNMIIEGIVEGSVKTNQNLFIGNKSKISASVEANDAKIGGEINGDIKINNYLEILASAKINGNITASKISIEKGATFNGNCIMTSKNSNNTKLKK